MKPSVLILIRSDPRTSHRPAEGLRIATGLAVWNQIDVGVYLEGPAGLLLSEDAQDLKDAEVVEQCRSLIAEKRMNIASSGGIEGSLIETTRMNLKELSEWTLQFQYSASF